MRDFADHSNNRCTCDHARGLHSNGKGRCVARWKGRPIYYERCDCYRFKAWTPAIQSRPKTEGTLLQQAEEMIRDSSL